MAAMPDDASHGQRINFFIFCTERCQSEIVPAFDSNPGHTLVPDSVSSLVFDPSPVLHFSSGSAFDYDPGLDLDSVPHPVFNFDYVTSHSSNLANNPFTFYKKEIIYSSHAQYVSPLSPAPVLAIDSAPRPVFSSDTATDHTQLAVCRCQCIDDISVAASKLYHKEITNNRSCKCSYISCGPLRGDDATTECVRIPVVHYPSIDPRSARYSISIQETGNALEITTELRVSTGGDDHLVWWFVRSSHPRNTIKKRDTFKCVRARAFVKASLVGPRAYTSRVGSWRPTAKIVCGRSRRRNVLSEVFLT
ncbi:hypothetical protein EVAR_14477_1 [Eumeta japonica]|uniref:Uncharacterized protein n=1 Tax=Eumeta variegata TaxID=151549 RepID=A0A4C1U354_EUMVA|nr:hypothetical protein EVAR_14477_1 [Eumeta japonica]